MLIMVHVAGHVKIRLHGATGAPAEDLYRFSDPEKSGCLLVWWSGSE